MNKTININLGGLFFHIDEIAFQKLRKYLDSISRSLSDDPQGKNEIINDIEARISELLSEKITDPRQVVNEGDIDEVIKVMGQPEDYADAEEGYAQEDHSYRRRKQSGKKLYRDGDDKFLGGVASGIAYYFDVDTVWIRLAFILFAFGGFGVLTYIILWIVIPQAETTAEKLQMEGEAVNIDNIEKKIREEFSNVSERIKKSADGISDKVKDGAKELTDSISGKDFKKYGRKANSGLQEFLDTLGRIAVTFFKVIGKFIGVILMFVAIVTLLSLFITAFSVGSLDIIGIDHELVSYPPFFSGSMIPTWILTTSFFLAVGLPFLILFVLGLRILSSNVKQFSKATSLTLFGIWLVALLTLIFSGIEFTSSKAANGYTYKETALNLAANDTISLKMLENDFLFEEYNSIRNSNYEVIYQGDIKKLYSNEVRLDVEKSETGNAYVKVRKLSEGKNKKSARKSAKELVYNFNVVNNEILFDNHFLSAYKNIIKDESVNITVYIPEGVTVYFDKSSRDFLSRIDNTTDTYDRDMAGHYFLMTEFGLDSKELNTNNDE